uniref:Eukaryotic translation initiation factor 4C n=1 Tax=Sinocyclocheilus rhinocerous TaxID=307959 RepID=A0A673G7G4_9TELE
MPKNKGKGGKNRRRGKNENESEKRELVFKEDGQEYGQVIKMLGNGRLEAMCFDGVKRLCHIRGKLRKKVWINASDIILVGLRDYQDTKADVILKYNADEARSLKAYGELPEHAKINETDTFGPGDDDEIQFDDIGSDDEDIDDVFSEHSDCHNNRALSHSMTTTQHRLHSFVMILKYLYCISLYVVEFKMQRNPEFTIKSQAFYLFGLNFISCIVAFF